MDTFVHLVGSVGCIFWSCASLGKQLGSSTFVCINTKKIIKQHHATDLLKCIGIEGSGRRNQLRRVQHSCSDKCLPASRTSTFEYPSSAFYPTRYKAACRIKDFGPLLNYLSLHAKNHCIILAGSFLSSIRIDKCRTTYSRVSTTDTYKWNTISNNSSS
ncbi:hypothetical protein BGZ60DRAFT_215410 [Tricladium varicosporioides]|nr:hypothetical protein BGZ60DRAFT_215410 [Hymenoscyphus varicosporioides]